MDDRNAKKPIDALDRNTEALEAGNKLTSAVLKASGKQTPRQSVERPQQTTDPFANVGYGRR